MISILLENKIEWCGVNLMMRSLIFLLKQDDIKSFDDLVTLKVDLNEIPDNEHIFGFRTLFSKMEKEIDEGNDPALTICLSFIDNYQNVLTIVRQAGRQLEVVLQKIKKGANISPLF